MNKLNKKKCTNQPPKPYFSPISPIRNMVPWFRTEVNTFWAVGPDPLAEKFWNFVYLFFRLTYFQWKKYYANEFNFTKFWSFQSTNSRTRFFLDNRFSLKDTAHFADFRIKKYISMDCFLKKRKPYFLPNFRNILKNRFHAWNLLLLLMTFHFMSSLKKISSTDMHMDR